MGTPAGMPVPAGAVGAPVGTPVGAVVPEPAADGPVCEPMRRAISACALAAGRLSSGPLADCPPQPARSVVASKLLTAIAAGPIGGNLIIVDHLPSLDLIRFVAMKNVSRRRTNVSLPDGW